MKWIESIIKNSARAHTHTHTHTHTHAHFYIVCLLNLMAYLRDFCDTSAILVDRQYWCYLTQS